MRMLGRGLRSSKYHYGVNGQEKMEEIDPKGNHNTSEFWEYDTRIRRRWNLDSRPRVGVSDYSLLNNSPITNVDPNGDCFRTILSKAVI